MSSDEKDSGINWDEKAGGGPYCGVVYISSSVGHVKLDMFVKLDMLYKILDMQAWNSGERYESWSYKFGNHQYIDDL